MIPKPVSKKILKGIPSIEEEDQHNQNNIRNNKCPRGVNQIQEIIKRYKNNKMTRINMYI
jgi:hypothetical protein